MSGYTIMMAILSTERGYVEHVEGVIRHMRIKE
jgi:hypothetical protein